MDILVELNYKQKNATRLMTTVAVFMVYLLVKDNHKLCLALGAILYLMLRNITYVYVVFHTFGRDIVLVRTFYKKKKPNHTNICM